MRSIGWSLRHTATRATSSAESDASVLDPPPTLEPAELDGFEALAPRGRPTSSRHEWPSSAPHTASTKGVAIDNAQRNDAPWVALALALSGQIDIALWSRLALVIDVRAASPFTRSRFSYSSGTTAFETPAVGGRFALTLALRL